MQNLVYQITVCQDIFFKNHISKYPCKNFKDSIIKLL